MLKINTPIKNVKNSICLYCGKSYIKKTSLEKHELVCSIIYKSKRELKIEEEEATDIPNTRQLYEVIKELTLKISKLEEKVNLQQKFIDNKKKKINIIEWLNNNKVPTCYLNDYILNNLRVKEEDILFLMNNSFLDTINNIIQFNFNTEGKDNTLPIFCFTEKPNLIYYYHSTTTTPTWSEINKVEYVNIFNTIYSKIFKKLLEWKRTNEDLLTKSEKLEDLYIKTVSKLMSVDFKQETTFSRTKTIVFNIIKTEMKQLIEYEFDF